MYGVFRSGSSAGLPLRLLLAHVSSHTATQDRHGHTPRHCWHTTHMLGSTEHPPFTCSRTTQQPATAVHSPVSVHNTSSTGNAVRVCRQGTEAKTHQPELQADGPPSSTSTFHTHASSETALHTRCVCVPLYSLRMMSTQCLQKSRLRSVSLLPVHPSKRNPARVSSYYMATATAHQSNISCTVSSAPVS
eukprot:COSAG03_NODE_5346_length_1270_cov_9.824082_1_plen_190_part_00